MNADVIVIGGGHNGLIAACYMARAGLDVVVLEAMAAVGGMSGTHALIREAPDHRINSCAVDITFIRATGIIEELQLARFGYREVDVDPPNVYLDADGASIALWRNPERTAAEIRAFSRADAEAYLDLMRVLDAALDVGLPLLTSHPCHPGARSLAQVGRAAARRRHELGRIGSLMISSAAQVVDEYFRHPIVRDAIATQAGIGGPNDRDGSALNLILVPWWHRFGAGRPVGGTQALPDALVAALKAAGGRVQTGAVVEQILVADGRAGGVRLEGGEELRAHRAVVATCDPRMALGTLLPRGILEPKLDARVAHMPVYGDGWAHLKVDVALSGRLRLERHEKQRGDGLDLRVPSTIIGGYNQAVDSYREGRAGRLPAEPCMWVAVPTAADPSQAPAGQDTLYVFANGVPLAPNVSWESLAADAAKRILDQVGQFYDGIEALEIGRWVETPDDFARRLRVTNGCLYHVDFSLLRLGPLRPALGFSGYRTPVPGLYLGGAGSHPSPAVTGVPGRLAAGEVLRACRDGRGSIRTLAAGRPAS